MARPSVFLWTAPNTTAVALTQTLAGAGNLTLNGSLASGGAVTFPSYTRKVSLTSANNLAGIQFTITGITNGVIFSETIAGPNNNTVQTTNIFDGVTGISTNGAAAAVSAGTGTAGRTHWFLHNYHATFPSVAIQVNVTATIAYTFNTTLMNVSGTSEGNILTFQPIADMISATGDTFSGYFIPSHYSSISIDSSDASGALTAIFLQQGIT